MTWLNRLATTTLGVATLSVGGIVALATLVGIIRSFASGADAAAWIAWVVMGALAATFIVKGRRWLRASTQPASEMGSRRPVTRVALEVPCDDALLAAARAITRKHIYTLAAERRSRLVPDKYGIADRMSWESEVTAFCSRAARPHVEETLSERDIRRAVRSIARAARKQAPNVSDDELLMSVLRSVVEAETAAHESAAVVASPSDLIYSTPAEFEEWCALELRAAGWTAATIGGSGDQGVDVRASRDGTILVMQCKLYDAPVGNAAVQEVFAGKAFHRAQAAVVVATKGFTKSARALAVQTDVHLLSPEQIRVFSPASMRTATV